MEITEIYTREETSYFRTHSVQWEKQAKLGTYSFPTNAKYFRLRKFDKGLFYDWHTAPRSQYIIYLEGEVEVIASGGEKKIFHAGDILFANDLSGIGHTSKTIQPGKALIIVADAML